MSKRSIAPTPRKRKQPTTTTPPAHGDLICPRLRCRAVVHFSTELQQAWCGCGWRLALTPEQTREITNALAGITGLNIPAYLTILDAEQGGGADPPPLDHLTTIYLRRALLALDTGVAA